MSRRRGAVANPRDDWQTPRWLLDALRAELGPIGLDPCGAPNNPTDANECWWGSGLERDWRAPFLFFGGWVFVNPPFSGRQGMAWARKAVEEARRCVEIVLLLPSSTNGQRFRFLMHEVNAVAHFCPRVAYVDPSTGLVARDVNFDSSAFYFGPREWEFVRAVRPYATTCGRKTGIVAQEAA